MALGLFRTVKIVLITQLATIAVASVLVYIFRGCISAYSTLVGGMISFVPNVAFGLMVGCKREHEAPQRIIQRFYCGEGAKLLAATTFLAVAFNFGGFESAYILLGFVSTLPVNFAALLLDQEEL